MAVILLVRKSVKKPVRMFVRRLVRILLAGKRA
jgi:hypothetical protein